MVADPTQTVTPSADVLASIEMDLDVACELRRSGCSNQATWVIRAYHHDDLSVCTVQFACAGCRQRLMAFAAQADGRTTTLKCKRHKREAFIQYIPLTGRPGGAA